MGSLISNSFKLSSFAEAHCGFRKHTAITYICFIIMVILKVFFIALFNLELTFKQPYQIKKRFLYPFMMFFLSPLLQLPQNVYNFSTCNDTNKVILVEKSWNYLEAILYTALSLFLFYWLRNRVSNMLSKMAIAARIWRLLSKLIKAGFILAAIAWNVIGFVVVGGQISFVGNLFYDFMLYIMLCTFVIGFWIAGKYAGESKVINVFIKEEVAKNEEIKGVSKIDVSHNEEIKVEVH